MRKERKTIGIDRIQLNTGQLDWLPANPRTWTQEDIDRTADSIREDEDFLEERPLLVVPFGKEYVCFAGNLRHEGCKALKKATAPCVVHYPETEDDRDTILRRAMKDNGSFGKTDWDAVFSSKWGELPVEKWGLTPPSWEQEEGGDSTGTGQTAAGQEDDFDEDDKGILVRCKPGDVWQLGEHRLMCGDSVDLEQVKTLMGGGQRLIWYLPTLLMAWP